MKMGGRGREEKGFWGFGEGWGGWKSEVWGGEGSCADQGGGV